MSNLTAKWWTRSVIYPNFIVILWTLLVVVHLWMYFFTDFTSGIWAGLAIGIFGTIAATEMALRYRKARFGRV